ncbi:hypothetical protein A4A49_60491, partial [Nicotiana attenuata]
MILIRNLRSVIHSTLKNWHYVVCQTSRRRSYLVFDPTEPVSSFCLAFPFPFCAEAGDDGILSIMHARGESISSSSSSLVYPFL